MVSKVNLGENPANVGIQLIILMGISDGVGPSLSGGGVDTLLRL